MPETLTEVIARMKAGGCPNFPARPCEENNDEECADCDPIALASVWLYSDPEFQKWESAGYRKHRHWLVQVLKKIEAAGI